MLSFPYKGRRLSPLKGAKVHPEAKNAKFELPLQNKTSETDKAVECTGVTGHDGNSGGSPSTPDLLTTNAENFVNGEQEGKHNHVCIDMSELSEVPSAQLVPDEQETLLKNLALHRGVVDDGGVNRISIGAVVSLENEQLPTTSGATNCMGAPDVESEETHVAMKKENATTHNGSFVPWKISGGLILGGVVLGGIVLAEHNNVMNGEDATDKNSSEMEWHDGDQNRYPNSYNSDEYSEIDLEDSSSEDAWNETFDQVDKSSVKDNETSDIGILDSRGMDLENTSDTDFSDSSDTDTPSSAVIPLNPPANTDHLDHVVIEMEPSENPIAGDAANDQQVGHVEANEQSFGGPSIYLKKYYDMMYYFGNITYKTGENADNQSPKWESLKFIQKVVFWCLSVLSWIQSVCRVKTKILAALSNNAEYYTLVSIAFYLAAVFAKFYVIYLFSFKKGKTDRMLQSMVKYENTYHRNDADRRKSWKVKLVIFLAITTFTFATSYRLLANEFPNPGQLVQDASKELHDDLFVWSSKKNTTNDSDAITEEDEDIWTFKNVAMASIVLLRQISNNLQIGMVFDIIIILSIVMYVLTKKFIREIREITPNVPKENVEEWERRQARREAAWNRYRMLKTIDTNLNAIFDPLLKLFHIQNVLTYAFFVAIIFFSSINWIAIGLFFVNLMKANISYYMAGKVAEVNDVIRAWIRNWSLNSGKIIVDGEEMVAAILLDELDNEPIGFGIGKFLINQSFHFKFVGLVGSVFISMADEEKKDN